MRFFALYILLFLASVQVFSQKKLSKIFELTSSEVVINTAGLDNIHVENSNNNNVEVILTAESYNDQLISIKENAEEANISFYFEGTETREVVFRKFITKRLQRAEAKVKIPKNKKVTIVGQNIDIETKSIKNPLEIYIDNGIVKLNTIKENSIVKLYSGNIYVKYKDVNVNIKSSLGKIKIDDKTFSKEYTQKNKSLNKGFIVETIKGHVFATSI